MTDREDVLEQVEEDTENDTKTTDPKKRVFPDDYHDMFDTGTR